MNKRLIFLLAFAFVVGTGLSAYAAVQNMKVGGDLIAGGIVRDNFSLGGNSAAGNKNADKENLFLSQLRVKVDADLTDNVATTVRLINERSWGQAGGTTIDIIDIDLAYVTLKEFLYSPLTLTLGRQEIDLGNGLIISNSRNYGTFLSGTPSDLSLRKAFDAIRANLNYDPLEVDAIYAKVAENTRRGTVLAPQNDDKDLYGVNVSYNITKETKAEGYLFYLKNASTTTNKNDNLCVVGGLLSGKPIDNLTASIESAFQLGDRTTTGSTQKDYKAWALQPILTYDLKGIQKIEKYAPQVSLSCTYLSGDKVSTDSRYQLWNPVFFDQSLNSITHAIIPFSNLQVINLGTSAKPVNDVTLLLDYGYYRLAKKASSLTAPYNDSDGVSYGTYTLTGNKELGSALDICALYDYTEDVQIGLATSMFFPGKAFDSNNDAKAMQVIGSMKVTF